MKDFFVPKDLLLFSNSMGMNSSFAVRGFSGGMSEAMGTLTVSAETVTPGIQLVSTSIGTGNMADYTVNLPDGAQEGDFVLVVTGVFSTSHREVGVVSPAGYTEIADLYANDTYDANLSVNYKILGHDPETSITVYGNGTNTAWGSATVIMLWRGVDQTTPFDVDPTTATGINSTNANPPAITPISEGAVIVTTAGWVCQEPQNPPGFPANFENQIFAIGDTGAAVTIAACSKVWSGSGAEDPGSFSDSGSISYSAWCSLTLALRPA